MEELKISKEEIKKIIEGANYVLAWHSDRWIYPKTGDDPGKCPMLSAMFNIEHRKGYIIFVQEDKKDA
jgi:hypothetical protein